jgi:Cyclin, N-terminal domain
MHRVAATACVFFRRFYLRNDFCTVDPRAVAPAALYLASKVEETLLQARHLFHIMQKLAGNLSKVRTECQSSTVIPWSHLYVSSAAVCSGLCITVG